MKGRKMDQGKYRFDLVPAAALRGMARALAFGEGKYSRWNWREGLAWSRLYGSVQRHLVAWFEGVEVDEESGLHPLDHAIAAMAMLRDSVEGGHGVDDRGGEKDLTADDADGRGYKGGISLEGEFPPITCRRCEELLWRAIHNARHPRNAPLWVQVKSALGFGSNRARWACRQFGLDPEQVTAFDDEGEESAATSNFRGWLWDRVNRIGEPVVIEHAADCPKDDTCVCSGMRFLNAFLAEDESPF